MSDETNSVREPETAAAAPTPDQGGIVEGALAQAIAQDPAHVRRLMQGWVAATMDWDLNERQPGDRGFHVPFSAPESVTYLRDALIQPDDPAAPRIALIQLTITGV